MEKFREPEGPSMDAWVRFLEAHARITAALDDELESAVGMSLAWYDVLVQLSEAGGRRTMSDLADALLLTRSNCTRLVDRMQLAGYVERVADTDDARSRWAVLTPTGRARLREASPVHLAGVYNRFAQFLDESQATVLAERFEAMVQAVRAERRDGA